MKVGERTTSASGSLRPSDAEDFITDQTCGSKRRHELADTSSTMGKLMLILIAASLRWTAN